MKRAALIKDELGQIKTIDKVAQAYKGISSMHISRIKNQVLSSKKFFGELWGIYNQLRKDDKQRFKSLAKAQFPKKELMVVITGEGGLGGELDEKLIEWVLKKYDAEKNDIIVLGHRGALRFAQKKVDIKHYYHLPKKDSQQFNPQPIIQQVNKYGTSKVYYQTYVTLSVQDIATIDLVKAVHTMSEDTELTSDVITPRNYIFEPSLNAVLDYMESSMLGIALSQAVLEAKLAQHASRFNAMSMAHTKAQDLEKDLQRTYHRAERSESDARLREIINGFKGRR